MKVQAARYAFTLLFVCFLPLTAQAVDLSLSSTAPDLNALVVGETLTVQVELSDLSGMKLELLAATVTYPSALLGTPVISPGSIIPNAAGDFVSFPTPNVDGSFFSTTNPIETEGIFYSFDLEVIKAGSGSLKFDYADAKEFGGGSFTPTKGSSLDFIATVPEPSSLMLILLTFASLLLMQPVRRCYAARRTVPVSG